MTFIYQVHFTQYLKVWPSISAKILCVSNIIYSKSFSQSFFILA